MFNGKAPALEREVKANQPFCFFHECCHFRRITQGISCRINGVLIAAQRIGKGIRSKDRVGWVEKVKHLAHAVANFTRFIDPFDSHFYFIVLCISDRKRISDRQIIRFS